MGRGEALWIDFDLAHHGLVQVDVFAQRWPDEMGDVANAGGLTRACAAGVFGPLVFAGSLERAVQHAVAFPEARAAAARHGAFVRLRTGYSDGAAPQASAVPDGWQPLLEIDTMLQLARRVLDVTGAIALFDPNCEVILPRDEVDASFEHAKRAGIPPLDLVTHVRLFNVAGKNMSLMDSLGLERFRLLDAELLFARNLDADEGAAFLRNLTLDHVRRGAMIADGVTREGPGGSYRAQRVDTSIAAPSRPVVRFTTTSGAKA